MAGFVQGVLLSHDGRMVSREIITNAFTKTMKPIPEKLTPAEAELIFSIASDDGLIRHLTEQIYDSMPTFPTKKSEMKIVNFHKKELAGFIRSILI